MDRVKRQLGCSEKIQYSVVTEEVCVAVLDTGERVINLTAKKRLRLGCFRKSLAERWRQ